ncbi:hypothetical protein CAter10_4640 [Collimonas arenae]|nr:hypothetical protein CAter10_4640 [Collimonas arenae]
MLRKQIEDYFYRIRPLQIFTVPWSASFIFRCGPEEDYAI